MNAKLKRDLCSVYTDIGETLAKQGNGAGSLERYRMALDILETLAAADTADVFNRQDLSHLCRVVGDALSEERRFTEAGRYYARAAAMAEACS
ncbi:MAG: hypothetical protein HGA22_07770 [Clostridiales bacterium]|nr:hypothetical protein [Clostridiales bacterium]